MKNKILLPILLLAAMTVTGCGKQPVSSSEQPGPASSDVQPSTSEEQPPVSSEDPVSSSEAPSSSEDPVTYGVAINNKAQLTGEWYKGTTRDLDITLTPAANALQEIAKGNLVITSSDPTIVAVTGLGLNALAKGQATITVKYHNATDTVAVDILSNSAKDKYGVAHDGTEDDPFTNEDALVVAKSDKYEKEVYYVKGKVASFYNAPGSRTDGMVAYFLEPATTGGEKFEIYKCFKADGSALTEDDIWVGGEATAYGSFTKYNSQYETSSATFVSCTGNKPQPRQTLEKTFAQTLEMGQALPDGGDTYDYIKFIGFVSAKEGNNFWLTATKGEALVKGKSDEAHGNRDIYTNAIELYNAGTVSELVAKLLEGAEVEVTMLVKNYHGTVENGLNLADENVVVKTPGTQWAVPEPAVGTKTLAEFIALENSKAKAYNVTATVKSWKDASSEKDKYGNMVLTDGTNDLVIYGATATATALAWDNSSAYAFTNPKDFLTNEVTAALAIGDEVTMKLIRADYNGAVQGSGIITNVTPAGSIVNYSLIEKFDFASDLTTYKAYNADEMNAFIKGSSSLGAANTNYVSHVNGKTTDSSLTDPLIGGNGKWSNVNWSNYNMLKLGSTSKNCKMTLSFKDGTAISRVVMKAAGWNGKTCKIGVNGGDQVSIPSAPTAASMEDESAFQTFTFDLASPAKEIVFETTLCVMISELELYAVEGGETPVENEAMPWYTEGTGNQAIHFEGAGIWTWVKYDSMGFENFAAFDAAKANFVATYESEPAATIVEKVVSDDNATLKYARVYIVLSAAYNTGKLTLTIPGADGKTYEGTLEFAAGELSKINGEAAATPVAQPVGAFRGLAKTAAATFIPVDLVLAADSAALSVNGEAANVTSYNWDNKDTLTVVTDGAYGTVTAKFAENVFQITGLTGAAAAQLDLTFAVQLSGNCQFIDAGAMTLDQMNETFVRRYDRNDGAGWQINKPSDGKISAVTVAGRAGLQCNGFSSGKVGFTLKNDLSTPIPGTVIKSVGCWIYNPGESAITMKLFAYKSANRATNGQLNTFTVEPGWHFYQTGVVNGSSFTSSDSFYNFQFFYENVSVNPVFDDLCIYM